MLKKSLSLALAGLVLHLACAVTVGAATKAGKEARRAEEVKAAIAKLGTGPDARVEVKLRDKTRLKGYVAEAGGEHFTVVDAKLGTAANVPYPQVAQVKGNNLSTGVKIAIGLGIIIGVLLIITLVALDER